MQRVNRKAFELRTPKLPPFLSVFSEQNMVPGTKVCISWWFPADFHMGHLQDGAANRGELHAAASPSALEEAAGVEGVLFPAINIIDSQTLCEF